MKSIVDNSRYVDAHTHAHFSAFENDWKEVIDRALENNVWMINVGTQRDTSARSVEVAHMYREGVYAAVGLHPIHTDASWHDKNELGGGDDAKALAPRPAPAGFAGFTSRGEEFSYEYYKRLATDQKVVAIGECGLDFYRSKKEEVRNKQERVFRQHIELAREIGKPLMIHCRDAFSDLISILNDWRLALCDLPSVVHFFTGTPEDAKKLLELGFSFTFGGVITFTRDYDEAINVIPMDRILSETDAPYVAPVPYRGKRNEPAYVVEVVKKLAELKGVSLEVMRDQIWENAKRIFGK